MDVFISIDTSQNTFPCIHSVQDRGFITSLFTNLPSLRLGFILHGDYGKNFKETFQLLQPTADLNKIMAFLEKATPFPYQAFTTSRAYENSLREFNRYFSNKKLHSLKNTQNRFAILCGPGLPHPSNYTSWNIDWRNEIKKLVDNGVVVNTVQILNYTPATRFYMDVASMTGGVYQRLYQQNRLAAILLQVLENNIAEYGRDKTDTKDTPTANTKIAVSDFCDEKWQEITIDENSTLKEYLQKKNIRPEGTNVYYELQKGETLLPHQQIIVKDALRHLYVEGDAAKRLLGLHNVAGKNRPKADSMYTILVETKINFKQIAEGNLLLYEVRQ